MQSPTPPTKPIPPTPPTMKTTNGTHSTDTPPPAKTVTQTPVLPQDTQSPPASNITSQGAANIPLMRSGDLTKDSTSETTVAPTMPIAKNSSSSFAYNFFFVVLFLITLTIFVVYWLKNNSRKVKPIVDYSAKNSDDIVNLILSPHTMETTAPSLPKLATKKIAPKVEVKDKNKGGFEVRI